MVPPEKDEICALADGRIVLFEGVIQKPGNPKEYVVSNLLEATLANGKKAYRPCPISQRHFASIRVEYIFDHGEDILTKDGYWADRSKKRINRL